MPSSKEFQLQRKNKILSELVQQLKDQLTMFKLPLKVEYNDENGIRIQLPGVDDSDPRSLFLNEMISMRVTIFIKEIKGLVEEIDCCKNFTWTKVMHAYKRLKDHYRYYCIPPSDRITVGLVPESREFMLHIPKKSPHLGSLHEIRFNTDGTNQHPRHQQQQLPIDNNNNNNNENSNSSNNNNNTDNRTTLRTSTTTTTTTTTTNNSIINESVSFNPKRTLNDNGKLISTQNNNKDIMRSNNQDINVNNRNMRMKNRNTNDNNNQNDDININNNTFGDTIPNKKREKKSNNNSSRDKMNGKRDMKLHNNSVDTMNAKRDMILNNNLGDTMHAKRDMRSNNFNFRSSNNNNDNNNGNFNQRSSNMNNRNCNQRRNDNHNSNINNRNLHQRRNDNYNSNVNNRNLHQRRNDNYNSSINNRNFIQRKNDNYNASNKDRKITLKLKRNKKRNNNKDTNAKNDQYGPRSLINPRKRSRVMMDMQNHDNANAEENQSDDEYEFVTPQAQPVNYVNLEKRGVGGVNQGQNMNYQRIGTPNKKRKLC